MTWMHDAKLLCKARRTALWKGHSGTASSGLTNFIIYLFADIWSQGAEHKADLHVAFFDKTSKHWSIKYSSHRPSHNIALAKLWQESYHETTVLAPRNRWSEGSLQTPQGRAYNPSLSVPSHGHSVNAHNPLLCSSQLPTFVMSKANTFSVFAQSLPAPPHWWVWGLILNMIQPLS